MEVTGDLIIQMYQKMLTIRKFEETVMKLNAEGKLPGFVHLYIGEEAVAVGACSALSEDSYITSTHRGHGHIIAKGGDVKKMMAELYGKKTGYNEGRGGSMHITAMELGVLGANGIVGAGIPIATGAALASWLDNSKKVTLCFFGDGAANEGTFHESINMASALKLPVVYVCENNLYGVGTKQTKVRNIEDIADRAMGYGIPGKIVDGNDVLKVYRVCKEAVERARNGKGPTLIECKTYRHRLHFEGEPDTYRPKEEVEKWKKKDPISKLEKKVIEDKILDESDIQKLKGSLDRLLQEAADFAEESPYPRNEDALKGVFV